MTPPTPYSLLFPYTTLFRSAELSKKACWVPKGPDVASAPWVLRARKFDRTPDDATGSASARLGITPILRTRDVTTRSEEHTSELQSRGQLVCRLLLEKKKLH